MSEHDTWARYYDFVYEMLPNQLYNKLTDETLKVINDILPSGNVIDYGAGTGRLTIPLQEQGYRVVAVEKSKEMFNVLSEKVEKHQFRCLDMHNCAISEYKEDEFDLALCVFTVLNYLVSEKEIRDSIVNVVKHLKSGGYFLFDLPNYDYFQCCVNWCELVEDNFCRKIRISKKHDKEIFLYEEKTSGIMNGEKFEYEDAFELRNWSLSYIDELLQNEGMVNIDKSFLDLNNISQATYKLYQKN